MDNGYMLPIAAVVGIAIGVVLMVILRARERRLANDFSRQAETARQQEVQLLLEQAKADFSALSRKALTENADDFLKLAKTKLSEATTHGDDVLESKKKLIDARLTELDKKLTSLNTLIQQVDKQRAESHGALTAQLQTNAKATHTLQTTTAQLREALANPQRRGQWGERMAEDVLRLAGFIEGINYEKQERLADGGKPDFTFFLPDAKRVHMDVKFPLANYLKVLDSADKIARDAATTIFLRDVRNRIKEVTTRVYIDPSAGTVDYVMVFIPNEQIYGFIHEHDSAILDDALRQKVVLCSPLTLYAILAVIRQSVDNFRFEQNSQRILELLADFRKQWTKYTEVMDRMGRKIEETQKAYRDLVDTRTRMLERQIDRIDAVKAEHVSKPKDQILLQKDPPMPQREKSS